MSTTAPTLPVLSGIKSITCVIQTNANYQSVKLIPTAHPNNSFFLGTLIRFMDSLATGVWRSNINVITGGVNASGTAVFASVIATNTLVIGGVTITAVSSGATSVQFNVGATDTITAANAVKTINALTTLNKVVQASSSGATITISCIIPGTIGNLVTLSSAGGTITVAAALTGGTDGVIGNIAHGL